MFEYARLSWVDIISAQRGLMNIYRRKMTIKNVPDRYIPDGLNKKQLIGYQAFADACSDLEIMDVDYLKMKYLICYLKGKVDCKEWVFKYKLKTGFLRSEVREMKWVEKEKEEGKNGKRTKH